MHGLRGGDALVKCFLKIETSTKCGDPRNISPRSDAFLSVLGPYISSLEHYYGKHPRLVKGLDIIKRNLKMSELSGSHLFIEQDYARFDMSVSINYLLYVEYLFLTAPFQGPEHVLYRQALRLAMLVNGRSGLGYSYRVVGTRCSGDAHTSIGNGLINDFNNYIAFSTLPTGSWVAFSEGDDGIVGLRRDVVDQAIFNLHILPVLGFQLKLIVCKDLVYSSFCGRFLAESGSGITSYCDLNRTLAKLHTTTSCGDAMALLLAKCMSYYHTDAGTPIIGALVTSIIHVLLPVVTRRRLSRAVRRLHSSYWYRQKYGNVDYNSDRWPHLTVEAHLRAAVAIRTGYTPCMQMSYESYYKEFEVLGFIPDRINRIPHGWNLDGMSSVYGPVKDYVA